MTPDKPQLSVVGAAPREESGGSESQRRVEPATPEAAGGAKQSRRVWLLAALLLVVSAILIAQVQRARGLDSRVKALTLELISAREDIEIQRQHISVVRGEVDLVQAAASELGRRIAKLNELAGRDPLESQ